MSCGNPGALWAVYETPLSLFPPTQLLPRHLNVERLLWRAWATVRNKIRTVTQDVKEFKISPLFAHHEMTSCWPCLHYPVWLWLSVPRSQAERPRYHFESINSEAKQQQSVQMTSALPSSNLQSVHGWWMDHDSLWAVALTGEVWAGTFTSSVSCRGEKSSPNEASEDQRDFWAMLLNSARAEACAQRLRYRRYCFQTHWMNIALSHFHYFIINANKSEQQDKYRWCTVFKMVTLSRL